MEEFLEHSVELIKSSVTNAVIMIITMMGVGTFFNISFGVFRTAILKCMILVVASALVWTFFPLLLMISISFSLLLWCLALMALFDVEIGEAGIFTIIYHIVQFLIWLALHVN